MFYSLKCNLLSDELCNKLINLAENIGFEKAKVNVYGKQESIPKIRNNSRIEYTNSELSIELGSIVFDNFPEICPLFDKKILGLNDHFRYYHYSPTEYFKPHKDGHTKIPGKESLLTVLFYLNDTDGGETILMPDGYSKKESWITVNPKKGSILIFEHDIWHEAKPVNSGEKFVLRSDVFFAV